jgi:hypothetical protein
VESKAARVGESGAVCEAMGFKGLGGVPWRAGQEGARCGGCGVAWMRRSQLGTDLGPVRHGAPVRMTSGARVSATEGGGKALLGWAAVGLEGQLGQAARAKGKGELRVHGRTSANWATGLARLRLQVV